VRDAQAGSSGIQVSIQPESFRAAPGETAAFVINLENRSGEAQSQSLAVQGLPGAWTSLDFDERRRVFPGEQRSATLIVSVPADAAPDVIKFDVIARAGSAESTAAGTLEVLGAAGSAAEPPLAAAPVLPPAPQLSLSPGLIVWQDRTAGAGRVTLGVRNPGDTETEYTVSLEGLEAAWYTLPQRLRVPAGETLETYVALHPPARAGQGDYPFRLRVAVEGAPQVSAEAPGWLSVPAPAQPAPPPPPAEPVRRTAPAPGPTVTPPEVSLAPRTTFRFSPSETSAQAIVSVQNRSQLLERYVIRVEGIPPDWYGISAEEVTLEPGAREQIPLRLTPKLSAETPAGEYAFRVHVAPQRAPEAATEVGALIVIAGVAAFDARLAPVQVEGRRGNLTLSLINTGGVPLDLQVRGADPENHCRFRLPSALELSPGQEMNLPVGVSAKRNSLVGAPETFDFRLNISPKEGDPNAARLFNARFVHRPLMGYRTLFLALFVAGLAALVAVIIGFGSPKVGDAASWVGCQFDSDYRIDRSSIVTKDECGGDPRDVELDRWRLRRTQ